MNAARARQTQQTRTPLRQMDQATGDVVQPQIGPRQVFEAFWNQFKLDNFDLFTERHAAMDRLNSAKHRQEVNRHRFSRQGMLTKIFSAVPNALQVYQDRKMVIQAQKDFERANGKISKQKVEAEGFLRTPEGKGRLKHIHQRLWREHMEEQRALAAIRNAPKRGIRMVKPDEAVPATQAVTPRQGLFSNAAPRSEIPRPVFQGGFSQSLPGGDLLGGSDQQGGRGSGQGVRAPDPAPRRESSIDDLLTTSGAVAFPAVAGSADRRDPEKRGQLKVFEDMKEQAPEGLVLVYDQARIKDPSRANASARQSDITVIDPEYGMALIEVKKGRYDVENGNFVGYRADGSRFAQTRDPFEQSETLEKSAERAWGKMSSERRDLAGVDLPVTGVVAFPDMDRGDILLSADHNAKTLFREDLTPDMVWGRLGEILEAKKLDRTLDHNSLMSAVEMVHEQGAHEINEAYTFASQRRGMKFGM